jgi:hypothetical protein
MPELGQSLQSPLAKTAQLADLAGLGLAGPGFQVLGAAAAAEHVSEAADQVANGFQFRAAAGDLCQCGAAVVGEVVGRREDPAGCLPGRRGRRGRRDGGFLAEPGGQPAQGPQAALVAAVTQFPVQLLRTADSLVPPPLQVGPVRAEQPGPGQASAGDQFADACRAGVTADGLAAQA